MSESNEYTPSQEEQQLAKQTTEELDFHDRRKRGPQSPAEQSAEVKGLLENFTEQNDSQWEQLNYPDANLDYDTFIGELIHQQNKIIDEQHFNFGDIQTAKQLLFPTVLRHTTELLHTQQKLQELQREIYSDTLTKTLNQRFFNDELKAIIDDDIKDNRDSALIFIDSDNFKGLNDSLGHQYGDYVLETVGALLNNEVRDLDLVIRKGGDEFAIFLKNVTTEKAAEIAERIRNGAANTVLRSPEDGRETPKMTFSIGVATSDTASSFEEFSSQADIALYNSKRDQEGKPLKNYVTVYTPGMQTPPGGETGRE